jgi:hypothetical protein
MKQRFSRRQVIAAAAGAGASTAPAAEVTAPGQLQLLEKSVLAVSQMGYRPGSPKTVTLTVQEPLAAALPDRIAYYVISAGNTLPRRYVVPQIWKQESVYQWPFDLLAQPWDGTPEALAGRARHHGELKKISSRWGTVWQADFSNFREPGIFQIEIEFQASMPFAIDQDVYRRLTRSYLNFVYCQRSGYAIAGITRGSNLDDALLDTTREYVPAAGGWNDAGDLRKWSSLTAFHVEALATVAEHERSAFGPQAIDEIGWGNRWLHAMISPDGQVWEDIGGGEMRGGQSYDKGWWNENHPGCIAGNSGNHFTDNVAETGDERLIRSTYNPWVQFGYVRIQSMAARALTGAGGLKCLSLAERAWDYGRKRGHDERTLFRSAELAAAISLADAGSHRVTPAQIDELASQLLERQYTGSEGLSHYFMEKGAVDGFRSVGFSCDPPMALLRYVEREGGNHEERHRAEEAVRLYIERYLLADAASNPYGVPPYGVYVRQPHADLQTFRSAGRNRGVRTFIHPYNDQYMVHGTNSVLTHQAYLLARAAKHYGVPEWSSHAERLIQWLTGHNPTGLSMHLGAGYRHPVAFNIRNHAIPDAITLGFAGRPDDSPYLETSNLVRWSTQEMWGVPQVHLMGAVAWL